MRKEEIEQLQVYICDVDTHIHQIEFSLTMMQDSLVKLKNQKFDQATIKSYESAIKHLALVIDRWKIIRARSANRLSYLKSFS